MQRKGNAIRRESQVKNQISIGIDMGGSLWATAVQDWEAGKMSYYGLRDKVDQSKEDRVFDLVSNLRKNGKRIDVFYEAGRYGYWPARMFTYRHWKKKDVGMRNENGIGSKNQ